MKTNLFPLFFCLLPAVLCCSGCGCRPQSGGTIAALTGDKEEIDQSQRQKEVFDREIERLANLQDAPCLPETPGAEKLIQSADRLNKWIQDRTPDELWKPDERFLHLEKSTLQAAETARSIVRSFSVLQGKETLDEQENPVEGANNLQEERKRVAALLRKLDEELNALAESAGIPDIAVFSTQVAALQKKFSGLDSIRNLNAAAIRAFAKQLETETRQFANVAETLERLASELRIEGLFIHPADVDFLKQCTWLRDISNWACGDKQDPLERARNLFDWTVCNIDLKDPSNPFGLEATQGQMELILQYPWQTLILGFGTVWDRSWVFIELLRQQRIDACLLSVTVPVGRSDHADDSTARNAPLIWAVGVFLEDRLYLFSPMHGLPIPGPKGGRFAEDGSLEFEDIATLSQVLNDDKLLREMDVSENDRFPVTAEILRHSTALLLASPESVSMRMNVLETELSGEQNMVLSLNLQEQQRRFSELKELKSVDLWKYPFRAKFEQLLLSRRTTELMSPFGISHPKRRDFPLWTGRILYFKGQFAGQEGAMINYQQARVPDREIMEYRNHAAFRNDPFQETLIRLVSMYASYWLGTASFEVGSTTAAGDFFEVLDRQSRQNAWRVATKYMLGRIAEREKRYEDAARYFEQAAGTPSEAGNRLRARWIRRLSESKTSESEPLKP